MGVDTSRGHPAMDYNEHQGTYRMFIGLAKFSVACCVVVLAGMAFFLV